MLNLNTVKAKKIYNILIINYLTSNRTWSIYDLAHCLGIKYKKYLEPIIYLILLHKQNPNIKRI